MSVSLHVGSQSFEIGSPGLLHAFFSTVAVRLEAEQWGGRFPLLMKDLYRGSLDATHASGALSELEKIENELGSIDPAQVVWSFEDRLQQPPWGKDIAAEITSLATYFVTSQGQPLLEILRRVLRTSAERLESVFVR